MVIVLKGLTHDKTNTLVNIQKVTSGSTPETARLLMTASSIIKAGRIVRHQ